MASSSYYLSVYNGLKQELAQYQGLPEILLSISSSCETLGKQISDASNNYISKIIISGDRCDKGSLDESAKSFDGAAKYFSNLSSECSAHMEQLQSDMDSAWASYQAALWRERQAAEEAARQAAANSGSS